jgi:uncharacterized membrane protein YphA (DoxX/SURF4 family)
MELEKWKGYAPKFARYGLAFVFLTFGIMQWVDPASWLGYIPAWAHVGLSDTTLIYLNGTFDFVIGLFLLLGLLIRLFGAIAFFHLLGIVLSMGWNEVTIRDIGLMIVCVSVFLRGSDDWSIDKNIMWKWLH